MTNNILLSWVYWNYISQYKQKSKSLCAILYASYRFQQQINRVDKKIVNLGNTRNTNSFNSSYWSISFSFANFLVPEHLAFARRLVMRAPFYTKTSSCTELDTSKHLLYTRGTSIPLIYIIPRNSVWVLKPLTKQMRFLDDELPTSCTLCYASKVPDSTHITTLLIFVSSLAHLMLFLFPQMHHRSMWAGSVFLFLLYESFWTANWNLTKIVIKKKLSKILAYDLNESTGQFKVHHRLSAFPWFAFSQ